MIYMLLKDDYDKCDWGILEYNPDNKEFRFYIRKDKPFDMYPIFFNEMVYIHHTFVVEPYWMAMWIKERIIPPNRQNITSILRNAGLREYDEYGMLHWGHGRCPQDRMYLEDLTDEQAKEYAKLYNITFVEPEEG